MITCSAKYRSTSYARTPESPAKWYRFGQKFSKWGGARLQTGQISGKIRKMLDTDLAEDWQARYQTAHIWSVSVVANLCLMLLESVVRISNCVSEFYFIFSATIRYNNNLEQWHQMCNNPANPIHNFPVSYHDNSRCWSYFWQNQIGVNRKYHNVPPEVSDLTSLVDMVLFNSLKEAMKAFRKREKVEDKM